MLQTDLSITLVVKTPLGVDPQNTLINCEAKYSAQDGFMRKMFIL